MESSQPSLPLALQQSFASVDPSVYASLLQVLSQCILNSNAILSLEQRIKETAGSSSERVFLTLTAIFVTQTANPDVQWVAGIVLKNSLKDNLVVLRDSPLGKEELENIKRALFIVLQASIESGTEEPILKSNKLQEEFYLLLSGLIVKEYHQDDKETALFDEIVRAYQRTYNYHLLRIINDVFEDGNDDRMWRFVPQILPATLHYLSAGVRENKLLFNIWILMQTTQWTIGVDPDALHACFNAEIIQQILNVTLETGMVELRRETVLDQKYMAMQAGMAVDILQEKRYSAKILTLLFRDFLNAEASLRNKFSKPHCKQVYTLSLKCLQYYLPYYLQSITFNQVRYSGEGEEEEEDFEIEFQSLIVQTLSLTSTLISLYPKTILKDLKHLNQAMLLTMFMYSLKSPLEQEKNFQEDRNLFLTDFLMDASVDYESNLSVRSTMVDFIEEMFQHSEFNKQTLESVIAMLASDSFSINGVSLPSAQQVVASLQTLSSVNEVNCESQLFVPEGHLVLKQELAFFLIGSMHDYLSIQDAHVQQCLQLLTADTEHAKNLLLKLRASWLLEKLANNEGIAKRGSPLVKATFEALAELFSSSSDFVQNYQYLKSIHKYIKLLDLKGTYPDRYQQLVSLFMRKCAEMIPSCNEETVHVPLEGLTFLSKIDSECCARVCGEVMPGIITLYAQYYSDGMIGSDIVDLLQLWARIPNNQAFIQLFLQPHIFNIIGQFYKAVCVQGSQQEAQKLIDSSILKNMLSIFGAFLTALTPESLTPALGQSLDRVFVMLLEIMNASKEVFVCLYVLYPLTTFTQNVPQIVKQYGQQVGVLLRKILGIPGGLDESALLFAGHWVLALVSQGILQGEAHQQVILQLMARLARANMPSTAKSFMLPIAASILAYGDATIHFLCRQQEDFRHMLSKWLSYFPSFQDKFSRDLSRQALTMILQLSAKDITLAGVALQPGQYSKEDVLLQVGILSMLAADLIYKEGKPGAAGDDDFEDEDDFGDDIEVDNDGNEIDAFGFDEGGLDQADQQDEAAILAHYSTMLNGRDQVQGLQQAIRSIGQSTIAKIVVAVKQSGTDHFSKAEKEAVLGVFSQ